MVCVVLTVVAVVDGEALAAGSVVLDREALEQQRQEDPSLDHNEAIEDLFAEQLEVADLVLISRADRLNEQQLVQARGYLSRQLEQLPLESSPLQYRAA